MLTNIHGVPAENSFSSEEGKAIELQIVMDYIHHMGYMDKCDRMAVHYSIGCRTFKWTKKLFFVCYTWPFSIATFLLLVWGLENFTQRFSFYPHEEYAGTCWTRTESTKAIR